MKTWRSIVSLLLVLVFALELLPLSSFAVESNDLTATETVETAQPLAQSAQDPVAMDEPYVVGEVEGLREESVKHFRMSDGSFLAVQYGTPVHYKDENDQWQEIDNTLIEKDGKLVTKYGDIEKTFSQTLSDGKLFDVKVGDYSLGMSLMSPGGESDNVVTATEDSEQAELPTTAQESERTEEHADEQSAVSAEAAEASEDSKASKKTADSADNEAYENIEVKEKLTPAPVESSTAPTPVEDSVMRVVAAPSIKATAESKAPMRVNASERLTAEKLAARELSTAEVCYANALQSVDLKYHSTTNSVKESIIIKAPQPSYSYSFLLTLSGVTPQLQDDGSVICSDKDGESIFVIPAPYMIDAAGAVSLDAQYALTETDSKWILTVTADQDWLNDSTRVFPVTLDPSVSYASKWANDTLPITYVAEGDPATAHNKPTGLYVGYGGSLEQTEVYMAVIGMSPLPENSELTGAAIVFIQSSYSYSEQSSINITAHQVTDTSSGAGTANWIHNMTWNNKPTYDNDILDHCKVSSGVMVVSLDVTRAVQSWYNDSTITHALALTAYNPPSSGTALSTLCGYYSNAEPALYVSYRNNVGLESYYTNQAFDVGNAGSAFITDHSGQLTVLTPLVSFASASNPFSLELVYNSARDSVMIRPTDDLKTTLGNGMSLNIIQEIKPHMQGMLYTDGDGTQHFFSHDSSMGGADMYFDEDGLGLKIQIQDDSTYVLSNDDGYASNSFSKEKHAFSVFSVAI